jgi:hypothetical protein
VPVVCRAGQLGKGAGAAVRAYFAEAAGATAKFVTGDDGPRAGVLTFDDWDTDADEGATNGGSPPCSARSMV